MVSLEKGSLQPESDFAIVANDATVVGTKSPADPSPQPDSKDVVDASDATVAGAKRPADRSPQPDSMDVVMVDAEDADPEPAVKKSKVVDGTARPKRTRAVKKEDDKVEVKPTTTASAKGKGKAVKDENEEEEEKVVMKTVIKKGKAPVDELCSLQSKPPLRSSGSDDSNFHRNPPRLC